MAAVLVTGLFIITFVMQAFEIPSSSMENTLLIGDHVFVNRIQFAPKSPWVGPLLPYRDARRNDIVVFLSPQTPGLYVVKRIIGVPGDRIHLRNGVVYRNGEQLNESYVKHTEGSYPNPYRDNFPAVPTSEASNVYSVWAQELPMHIEGDDVVVPPEHYFAMGDNRDVSLDSRYWGFIPKENVIGRPMFIYWSFETPGDQYQKTSFGRPAWVSGPRGDSLLRRDTLAADLTSSAVKLFPSKRRTLAIVAVVVLLLFFLRPGAARLKSRIAASISAALGRPVEIGSVHIRLLQPGFDLENLVVYDDPAFGAEPMLRAAEVTADLRLTSLLRGRMEIARLDLTDPSLNLVHGTNGRWNLEALAATCGSNCRSRPRQESLSPVRASPTLRLLLGVSTSRSGRRKSPTR